jgi:hypothetical protein
MVLPESLSEIVIWSLSGVVVLEFERRLWVVMAQMVLGCASIYATGSFFGGWAHCESKVPFSGGKGGNRWVKWVPGS